jgi:hypothetical protein
MRIWIWLVDCFRRFWKNLFFVSGEVYGRQFIPAHLERYIRHFYVDREIYDDDKWLTYNCPDEWQVKLKRRFCKKDIVKTYVVSKDEYDKVKIGDLMTVKRSSQQKIFSFY